MRFQFALLMAVRSEEDVTHCANKTTARHFQHSWRFRTDKRDKRSGPAKTFCGGPALRKFCAFGGCATSCGRKNDFRLVPVCLSFRDDDDGSHYILLRPPAPRPSCYLSEDDSVILRSGRN